MRYGHELAVWTGRFLSELWDTEVLQPESMTGWMTNVRWPTDDGAVAGAVSARLLSEYDTRLNIFSFNGLVYSRVSLQIYLTMDDVARVGRLVLELLGEATRCLNGANSTSNGVTTERCKWVTAPQGADAESTRPAVIALAQ